MKKAVFFVIILSIFLSGIAFLPSSQQAVAKSLIVPDANNEYCPVTGAKITKKKYNTTYNGKRYWFSSFSALQKFKANPQAYADKLEANSTTQKKEETSRRWW